LEDGSLADDIVNMEQDPLKAVRLACGDIPADPLAEEYKQENN
jgi:hypothetical protein